MFTEPFCGYMNRIGGVIVSVLTKDFTIGICSFSA
jgi:hypothetical protein